MRSNGRYNSLGGVRDGTSPVWVRTELVESVLNSENGNVGYTDNRFRANKAGRKRCRPSTSSSSASSDWGWARAYILPTSSSSSSSPISTDGPSSPPSSPHSRFRLRRVGSNSPSTPTNRSRQNHNRKQEAETSLSSPSFSYRSNMPITLTIDDEDFAPPHLNNVTITLPPGLISSPFKGSTEEVEVGNSNILMANSWWTHQHRSDGRFVDCYDNEDEESGMPPDDLTTLTHLHEPAVVVCLNRRYQLDRIYTYTGPILLALNPFRVCDGLYGEEVMRQYWEGGSTTATADVSGVAGVNGRKRPHVYAIADAAFRNMMRSLNDPDGMNDNEGRDQSILVSGESGAGKTVTTKIIMRYLATLSQRSHDGGAMGMEKDEGRSIEAQVLQSNPILESFGNARTVRNDNSSRFGKFIEIQFLKSGCLTCASIETYLLEKVRLITQAPGERNYHIFYELLAGAPRKDKRELLIAHATPQDFRMTSASGTYDRRDGVQDADTYRDLRAALDTVGFNREEQRDLFSVACALLHASNLTFAETKSEASELDMSNPSLKPTLDLLGVTNGALNDALCTCAIDAGGERLKKNLSLPQATKALEAFIKATYGAMFTHIVRRVNESITVHRSDGTRVMGGGGRKTEMAYIGVLDIFGFESFDFNSFEQLCINYCNETLQQQFNRFVFKMEQQEYEREGIEWSFISFPDNQDVLDLIEKKQTGILSILDEQCRLAKCTDSSFARATYEKCSSHSRFGSSNSQKASGKFTIYHYAGPVEYNSVSFLEKNKDELPKETTDLLISSSHPLLPILGRILSESPQTNRPPTPTNVGRRGFHRSASSLSRASVGSQFTSQLRLLRERIDCTSPHYVRCLKPNDDLVPDCFNPLIIADQLRCAGVLEAIRVSRVGFPQRYLHASFVQRYRILAIKDLKRAARLRRGRELCEVLVKAVALQVWEGHQIDQPVDKDGYNLSPRSRNSPRCPPYDSVTVGIQMGRTKVFLRRRAFDALEQLRNRKIDAASIKIQSHVRMFLCRTHFIKALRSVLILQCLVRRRIAVVCVRHLRWIHSANLVQRVWRGFVAQTRFLATAFIAEWCQRYHRGRVGRRRYMFLNKGRQATIIQSCWRMWYYSFGYRIRKRLALALQTVVRARIARKILRQLKCEARDLSVVASERDRFREEAYALKKQLEQEKERMRKEVEQARRQILEKARQNRSPEIDCPSNWTTTEEVVCLREEVVRLKKELANARSITYRNFSSDPTEQEAELSLLVKECARRERATESLAIQCAQKDGEIKRLVNECAKRDRELEAKGRELDHLRREVEILRSVKKSYPNGLSVRKMIARSFQSGSSPGEGVSCDMSVGYDEGGERKSLGGQSSLSSYLSSAVKVGPRKDDGKRGMLSPFQTFLSMSNNEERVSAAPSILSPRKDKSGTVFTSSPQDRSVSMISMTSDSLLDADDNLSLTEDEQLPSTQNEYSFRETRFHAAVRTADENDLVEAVRESKDIHFDINDGDQEGKSPLHLAVLNSKLTIASFLIDHHAVANSPDNSGNTPLHFAETVEMIELLLEKGGANPNIPNGQGLRVLHFAVRRRDLLGVQCLIDHGADVNAADNLKWYTPLHLIAQSERHPDVSLCVPALSQDKGISLSGQIAKILCEATSPSKPDLNYQDRDGNTPLHHAAILMERDAGDLLPLFLENGADPSIENHRGQTPLHLLCHNKALRELECFQELLHLMLFHGGDPNQASMSGCTALHLALYHKDVDSAVQLVHHGAQLHVPWTKPARWETFWDDTGAPEVLALDMVLDEYVLHRILSTITKPQTWAPSRPSCMQCKEMFSPFGRQHHCRHCGRIVCGACSPRSVSLNLFPKSFENHDSIKGSTRVCIVCEKILLSRNDDNSSETQPTTTYLLEDNEDRANSF